MVRNYNEHKLYINKTGINFPISDILSGKYVIYLACLSESDSVRYYLSRCLYSL